MRVPAFVDDDGITLFESRAINRYLATKKLGRDLDPADPKRREVDRFLPVLEEAFPRY